MLPLLMLSAGILLAGRLPHLNFSLWLPITVGAVLYVLAFLLRRRAYLRSAKPLWWAGCICLGLGWGAVSGQRMIDQQLDPALEGEIFTIQGVISDLPEDRGEFVRFQFALSSTDSSPGLPEQMLLSWYGAPELKAGETWQITVKLRRPRGSVNTGGFDYQRWLLSREIGATGYVRRANDNQRLAEASALGVLNVRASLRDWLTAQVESPHRSLLVALLVGDSSAITSEQWQVLQVTGTGHLMAISGLHIGLVALCGFWLGRWLFALVSFAPRRWRGLYHLPALLSIAMAFTYASLAGFALPTKRALVMVVIFHVGVMLYRRVPVTFSFCCAVLCVLLIDPLAGYELGFWLSFGAVAVLLYGFSGRRFIHTSPSRLQFLFTDSQPDNAHSRRPWWTKIFGFGRAQWIILIGLLIPLTALNQTVTLLAPFANLVVIPLVSFLVVVPLLIAAALAWVMPWLATVLLHFATFNLDLAWRWLVWLSEWSAHSAELKHIAVPNWLSMMLAGVAVLWLLAPRGIPARAMALLLFLPLFFPPKVFQPPLAVTVLDVGQGLAMVVQVQDKVLLYDAGPAPSERFDAGEAIVLPYMRAQGINHIDVFVVSHSDNDHAGGAAAVIDGISVGEIYQGEDFAVASRLANKQKKLPPMHLCDKDKQWRWHDVYFHLLKTDYTPSATDHNNRSCVLTMTYQNQTVVIPGDIDTKVERALLASEKLSTPTTLMIAPHHGSRTSSSIGFVNYLQPRYVVYSAGYQNRYNHPHPKVVERYQQVGSIALQTGEAGQLRFVWDAQGQVQVEALRQSQPRYWYFAGSVEPVTLSAAGK